MFQEELNKKYRMFNMGNNITCTANCNYRIDVILYTTWTWFVPGIQLWILYIKVISDDDDWWCTSRMRSYDLREKVLMHQLGSWNVFFNDPINCYDVKGSPIDEWMDMEQWWNDNDYGNKRTLRELCPSAILFTTQPTRTGLGSNPWLCNDMVLGSWRYISQSVTTSHL